MAIRTTVAAHLEKWITRFCLLLVLLMPLASCQVAEFTKVHGPNVSYVAVSTGTHHACGLTDSGEVYCWATADPRPELVTAPVRFKSVSTFADHACGLSQEGEAFCWGASDMGQLGTTAELASCRTSTAMAGEFCSTTPIAVETDILFETIEVGFAHSCGLDSNGHAHCWGLNSWGQLGATSDTVCALDLLPEGLPCSLTPVEVDGGLSFESLSTGQSHSCAVTEDGFGYCWGSGRSGRLGSGSIESSPVPVPIAGNLRFITVSAGGNHTCGVTENGTAYCWGANAAQQLGSQASDRDCGVHLSACVSTPRSVATDLRFDFVTASSSALRTATVVAGHTCGIATDGNVYCWGLNESGQLGAHNDLTSATPILLDEDLEFTKIDAGMANTCGVTTDASMFCWQYGTPLDWWREFESSG